MLLSCYANVPAERPARLTGMLTGQDVPPGWAGKAAGRVNGGLRAAGSGEAMIAALAAQNVLAADETPVNVIGKTPLPEPDPGDAEADPGEQPGKTEATGPPHVLITATPDGRLTVCRPWPAGARAAPAAASPLMSPGTSGPAAAPATGTFSPGSGESGSAAGTSSAAAARSAGPAPGTGSTGRRTSSRSCARPAQPPKDARARGSTGLARQVPGGLLERCGTAAESGQIHSRLRAWGTGNHPGYALACRLQQHRDQVFLVTRDFAVDRADNISERGAKKARRRQAVPGYRHTLLTPGRWCRIASYPGSAAAHGTGAPGASAPSPRKALAAAAARHQLKPSPGTP